MSLVGAVVSLGALIVGIVFSALTLGTFFDRRKPYNLMWGVGLLLFTTAAFIQVVAELQGWTDGLFRTWYFTGITNVGFLGLGSVYLANRRAGHAFAAFILVLTAVFGYVVLATPTNAIAIATWNAQGLPPAGAGWGSPTPRLITPIINIIGAAPLIGLALYGVYRYRLWYNGYIAAGASIMAIGSALTRYNNPTLIYAGVFVGIVLMFVGFWQATEWAKEHRQAAKIAEAAEASEPAETSEKTGTK
jgi:hypothetical protein